ncbi:MAG: hypothetical protein ABI349_12165 [Casimicrobiaceae bacterium]
MNTIMREDAAFQIAAELALDIAGNRVAVIAPVASQREPVAKWVCTVL